MALREDLLKYIEKTSPKIGADPILKIFLKIESGLLFFLYTNTILIIS